MFFKRLLMAGGLSMVLVLGACGGSDEEGTEEEGTEEGATTEEDNSASSGDVDAEGIARDNCASCHGEDFSGGVGPALAGTSLSEADFEETVRNGQGKMPAFSEDQVSNDELSALYTFFSEQ